jgi:hypothetical protein
VEYWRLNRDVAVAGGVVGGAEDAPNGRVREIAGCKCLVANAAERRIGHADDARDLIGEAMSQNASIIVLPVSALDPSFFQLRSGLAGEILQKMVNYGRKLAVVGDVSPHVDASDAFRDLVREADRGDDLFFVPDMEALAVRIARTRVT